MQQSTGCVMQDFEDVKQTAGHVRDDAGHGSSAITDRYIDVERAERHASARNKLIQNLRLNFRVFIVSVAAVMRSACS